MTEDTPTKRCRDCKKDKPLEAFYKQKGCRLGVRPECKSCMGVGKPRTGGDRYVLLDGPQPTHRVCITCDQTKPLTEEFWYRHSKGGFRHECKACRGIQAVLNRYGVTKEQYAEMLRQQGGGCAICGSSDPGKESGFKLSVDHCHDTNVIRGLLCKNCNLAIGYFQDNPDLCRRGADYLEKDRSGSPLIAKGSRAS